MSTRNLVDSLYTGNKEGASEQFTSAVSDKVNERLEGMRQAISKEILTSVDEAALNELGHGASGFGMKSSTSRPPNKNGWAQRPSQPSSFDSSKTHKAFQQKSGALSSIKKFFGKEEVEGVDEVAPPGWEGSVKAMKKHKNISNPFALAWWMKNHGAKAKIHSKEDVEVTGETLDESRKEIHHFTNVHGDKAFIVHHKHKSKKSIHSHIPAKWDNDPAMKDEDRCDARGCKGEHESHEDAEKELKKHGFKHTDHVETHKFPDLEAIEDKPRHKKHKHKK